MPYEEKNELYVQFARLKYLFICYVCIGIMHVWYPLWLGPYMHAILPYRHTYRIVWLSIAMLAHGKYQTWVITQLSPFWTYENTIIPWYYPFCKHEILLYCMHFFMPVPWWCHLLQVCSRTTMLLYSPVVSFSKLAKNWILFAHAITC